MLLDRKSIVGKRIVGLQTGGALAEVLELIIDPRDLSVPAVFVKEANSQRIDKILHTEDIRQVSKSRVITNSFEDIMLVEDIPKLQEVIDIDFGLIGCNVKTESDQNLGKISSFAVDTKAAWEITKINVEGRFLKFLASENLLIDRSQIIEVSEDYVIVQDALIKDGRFGLARRNKNAHMAIKRS